MSSNLVKTSTYINKSVYQELQIMLQTYDISLREFIERSYLYVKDNQELQGKLLIETQYKQIRKEN